MKRIAILIAFITIAYPVSASAIAGLAVGAKIGSATYKGEVLPGSDDVGSGIYYGAIVEISTLPVLDFEIHANYFKKDFSYAYDLPGFGPVSQDFEFTDMNVLALAKKNIIPVPMSPIKAYVGGGVGWHVLNTEVGKAIAGGQVLPQQANDPTFLVESTGKPSVQGLLGLKLKFPVFPLAIYGEGQYGSIFADSNITIYSAEVGALFGF